MKTIHSSDGIKPDLISKTLELVRALGYADSSMLQTGLLLDADAAEKVLTFMVSAKLLTKKKDRFLISGMIRSLQDTTPVQERNPELLAMFSDDNESRSWNFENIEHTAEPKILADTTQFSLDFFDLTERIKKRISIIVPSYRGKEFRYFEKVKRQRKDFESGENLMSARAKLVINPVSKKAKLRILDWTVFLCVCADEAPASRQRCVAEAEALLASLESLDEIEEDLAEERRWNAARGGATRSRSPKDEKKYKEILEFIASLMKQHGGKGFKTIKALFKLIEKDLNERLIFDEANGSAVIEFHDADDFFCNQVSKKGSIVRDAYLELKAAHATR